MIGIEYLESALRIRVIAALAFSSLRHGMALVFLALATGAAEASIGMAEVDNVGIGGPVTVFYPAAAAPVAISRGDVTFDVARNAAALPGNRHLVMISHGSGVCPWVYYDLSRTLVEAGFVVAFPEHYADNCHNSSEPGPESWKRRPAEVSRAIDVVAGDERFQYLIVDRVGMYGMSAGGHTALTLAGGRWSPAQLRRHCDAHIAEDFQSCVGLAATLNGGILDGMKKKVARLVIDFKLDDETWYAHTESRIAAVVAGVPFAADFDPASLASPRPPLALISARQDKWLLPKYHSEMVLQACPRCERLVDLANGGHGALLSPLPPGTSGLLNDLIADPPGFDRAAAVPELNRRIADFFLRHLAGPAN